MLFYKVYVLSFDKHDIHLSKMDSIAQAELSHVKISRKQLLILGHSDIH